jgi:uncharacterized membrane protein
MTDRPDDGQEWADEAALDVWLSAAEELTPPEEPPHRRLGALGVASILLAVATVAGLVILRPTGEARRQAEALAAIGTPRTFHAAEVTNVERDLCPGSADSFCATVTFQLVQGPYVGTDVTQMFPEGGASPSLHVGETAVLSYLEPNATVEGTFEVPCELDPEQTCRSLSLLIDSAEGPTRVNHIINPGDPAETLEVGDDAIVDYIENGTGSFEVFSVSPLDLERQYQFADIQRRGVLFWLALAFAVVVVALGGLRGMTALFGLAASLAVLLLFVLPAILDGRSPVLVAVFGSAAIAYLALYLSHGFTRMTTVALIGTLAALSFTAVLSAIVVSLAHFTGLTTEESTLLTLFDGIDVSGLLLAGVVLGAAGALDDVTVTQASAVWELKAANPRLGPGDLFRRGLRIGRDHIASMVNTLLLAYAGAALPLLVLFVLSEQSLGAAANSEVVAVEIVRTLVGSIGLIAAVPLTTWLASITVREPHAEKT